MDTQEEVNDEEWGDDKLNWIFFSPYLVAQHVYNSLRCRGGTEPELNQVGWNLRSHHGIMVKRETLTEWFEQFKHFN